MASSFFVCGCTEEVQDFQAGFLMEPEFSPSLGEYVCEYCKRPIRGNPLYPSEQERSVREGRGKGK